MPNYHPQAIESKWQCYWQERRTFATPDSSSKPKYYILDMFPYPSGAGLHVGHPEGYTATDILARYRRMGGYNVLHPMGWDAFGLPAEQHAIATGEHPHANTQKNINTFRRQIQELGFSYVQIGTTLHVLELWYDAHPNLGEMDVILGTGHTEGYRPLGEEPGD